MQADILKKINLLVDMAGTSTNVETLQAELQEIEKESDRLKNELSLLTSDEINDKYFKASEKQVDENIKVSLEAKIRKQESSVEDLQIQIDSVVLEESKMHNTIVSLKEEISSCNDYISVLEQRVATIKDATSLEGYKTILKSETQRIDELNKTLKTFEVEYEAVLDKLNYLYMAKEEIQTKLNADKNRLQDTKASLVNPTSYIDKELKKIDKDRVEKIKNQLVELDKRKLEIITDPAMIADEAKQLILSNDQNESISKIKELITIVKSKPYMDLPNNADLSNVLQEELELACNKRDEFAALIDSKDYRIEESDAISQRIQYLAIQIENFEDKIRLLKEEIKTLDTQEFVNLTEKLNQTIELAHELEKSISAYEEIIANGEEKTPKRRAVLNSAFKRKQKDFENIQMIIENYRKDQKFLIQRTYEKEVNDIAYYENLIQESKKEIESLKDILTDASTAKDVLAIENDKIKLKELDDIVKSINHRQKFSETPDEIFDEIEIILRSTPSDEANASNSIMPKVVHNADPLDESLVMKELPQLEEDKTSERIKVVNIEPIDGENDNPFVIGSYLDEDLAEKESGV